RCKPVVDSPRASMPFRIFEGVGYELDQLVVTGRDHIARMDPAPLLLAGHRSRSSVFGSRSNDLACNLRSSIRRSTRRAIVDAGYRGSHVCGGDASCGSIARGRAGGSHNPAPAAGWTARTSPAGDSTDALAGRRSAKFLAGCKNRARIAVGG